MSTNLYLENEEYHEDYMDQLTDEGVSLQCEIKNLIVPPPEPSGSLPDVLMCTDTCNSRMEMPWLKISLPPSEFYEIRNAEEDSKSTVCDCFITDPVSDSESENADEAEDTAEDLENDTLEETQLASSCLCNTTNSISNCCNDSNELLTSSRSKFVYDYPDESLVEPYLSGICKMYDNEKSTSCGRFTEFPWSHILIPRNHIIKRCAKPTPRVVDEVKESDKSLICTLLHSKLGSFYESECECSCYDTISTTMSKQEDELRTHVDYKTSASNHALSLLEILKNTSLTPETLSLNASCTCNNIYASEKKIDDADTLEDQKHVCDDIPTKENKVETSTSYDNKYMGVDVNVGTSIEDIPLKHCNYEGLSYEAHEEVTKFQSKNFQITCENSDSALNISDANQMKITPIKRKLNKSTEFTSKTYQVDYGNTEPIISALETCQMEMEPIKEKVNELRTKIRNLNLNLNETTSHQYRKRHSHAFTVKNNSTKTTRPVIQMRQPPMYVPCGMLPFGVPPVTQFRLAPSRFGVQIPNPTPTTNVTPVVVLPGFTLPAPATEKIPFPSSHSPPGIPQSVEPICTSNATPYNVTPLTNFPTASPQNGGVSFASAPCGANGTPSPQNGVSSASAPCDINDKFIPPSLNAVQHKVVQVNDHLIDTSKPQVYQSHSLSPCTSSCCVLPSYLRHKMISQPYAQSPNVPSHILSSTLPPEVTVPSHTSTLSKSRKGNLINLCSTTSIYHKSTRTDKTDSKRISSGENYVSSLSGKSPTCKCPCNSSLWRDSKVGSIIMGRFDDLMAEIEESNVEAKKDGVDNVFKSKVTTHKHKGRHKEKKQSDTVACFCNGETTDTDHDM